MLMLELKLIVPLKEVHDLMPEGLMGMLSTHALSETHHHVCPISLSVNIQVATIKLFNHLNGKSVAFEIELQTWILRKERMLSFHVIILSNQR